MNVAGIVVYAQPGKCGDVREALARLPGVEIHLETADGRFIVTVEDTEQAGAGDVALSIHGTPGVTCAALAYHAFEPSERTRPLDRSDHPRGA